MIIIGNNIFRQCYKYIQYISTRYQQFYVVQKIATTVWELYRGAGKFVCRSIVDSSRWLDSCYPRVASWGLILARSRNFLSFFLQVY